MAQTAAAVLTEALGYVECYPLGLEEGARASPVRPPRFLPGWLHAQLYLVRMFLMAIERKQATCRARAILVHRIHTSGRAAADSLFEKKVLPILAYLDLYFDYDLFVPLEAVHLQRRRFARDPGARSRGFRQHRPHRQHLDPGMIWEIDRSSAGAQHREGRTNGHRQHMRKCLVAQRAGSLHIRLPLRRVEANAPKSGRGVSASSGR